MMHPRIKIGSKTFMSASSSNRGVLELAAPAPARTEAELIVQQRSSPPLLLLFSSPLLVSFYPFFSPLFFLSVLIPCQFPTLPSILPPVLFEPDTSHLQPDRHLQRRVLAKREIAICCLKAVNNSLPKRCRCQSPREGSKCCMQ